MKFKIKSILILVAIALSIVTAQVVMAGKTVFSDGNPGMGIKGTKVTAAFLNSVNKHFCTGLDVDGDCALAYSTVTGTNDLITTITPTTAFPASYVVGMPIYLKSAATNTGAMTVNVNGLGVKAIKKGVNQALIAGDIQSGALITVLYDGTNFQMYSPDTRGVAFGAASLDTNTRLIQDANTVWDGTAGRTASPTAAANKIPVAGAGSTLASTWMDFTNSQAASGYTKLPNGVIVQWGSGTGTSILNGLTYIGFSISFPLAFPTACRSVSITGRMSDAPSNAPAMNFYLSSSPTTTNFVLTGYNGTGVTQTGPIYYWQAIGY